MHNTSQRALHLLSLSLFISLPVFGEVVINRLIITGEMEMDGKAGYLRREQRTTKYNVVSAPCSVNLITVDRYVTSLIVWLKVALIPPTTI